MHFCALVNYDANIYKWKKGLKKKLLKHSRKKFDFKINFSIENNLRNPKFKNIFIL